MMQCKIRISLNAKAITCITQFSSFILIAQVLGYITNIAGCGKQYPLRHPSRMRDHLLRKHKKDLLNCDKPKCKFVSQQYYHIDPTLLFPGDTSCVGTYSAPQSRPLERIFQVRCGRLQLCKEFTHKIFIVNSNPSGEW